MLALLLWVANREADKLVQETLTPDFSAIYNIKTKKGTFFAYILPLVQHSNKDISRNRVVLLQTSKRLNLRIDNISAALALAQAAIWDLLPNHSLQPAFPYLLQN